MALGMIVGSLCFIFLIKRFQVVHILLFGIFMDGFTYTLLYFINEKSAALLLLFIHGIAIPLITISRTTIIQKIVPDSYRGRIFAINYMAVMGTTAFSILIVGFILEYISTHLLFLGIGISASLTMIIGFNHNFLHIKFK
jgi:MFS family permease